MNLSPQTPNHVVLTVADVTPPWLLHLEVWAESVGMRDRVLFPFHRRRALSPQAWDCLHVMFRYIVVTEALRHVDPGPLQMAVERVRFVLEMIYTDPSRICDLDAATTEVWKVWEKAPRDASSSALSSAAEATVWPSDHALARAASAACRAAMWHALYLQAVSDQALHDAEAEAAARILDAICSSLEYA